MYRHLQQIHLQRPGLCGPLNLRNLQQNHLQLNQLQRFFATCSSTTYSQSLTAGHLQQNRILQLQVDYFAADGRYNLSVWLQVVAASGFAASVLFLLQVSCFAVSDLLLVVELQVAKSCGNWFCCKLPKLRESAETGSLQIDLLQVPIHPRDSCPGTENPMTFKSHSWAEIGNIYFFS